MAEKTSSEKTSSAASTGDHTRRTYPPDPELASSANARPEMKELQLEEFWDQQARDRIDWFEPYHTVLEWKLPYAKWFLGGKLNACHNCVDRHVDAGRGDKVALHVVPDDGPDSPDAHDITYAELQRRVVAFANGLRKLGVSKGVPVGIYLQMVPDLVVAMLACARLGAPHTVVFGGFSGKAVAERCNDLKCRVLITQDEACRGGSTVAQKTNADAGLDSGPTTVEKVVVVRRTGGDVPMGERDVYLHDLLDGESDDPATCPCEPMDAEDLLFLLYTSGSTGKPKGVVHTTGGYLTGVTTTHNLVFDVKDDSIYWCAADVGWITGHSYIVYGPLSNGVTSVLYEGVPGHPDKDVWWKIVERYGITILYTSPTAIRGHMKWGPQHADGHGLSSIRILGSVGEPINPEAWEWYHTHVGGGTAPIVDTWWQTETGHIMLTPPPGNDDAQAGLGAAALPRRPARDPRRRRQPARRRRAGEPRPCRAVAGDDARPLPGRRAVPGELLVQVPGRLLRRGRRQVRRGRRHYPDGAHRRRHERVRAPDLDLRGGERADRARAGRRGGRRLAS
jgi:acetyl-CoA synthetase